MASYLLIGDPTGLGVRRVQLGDVPALFCLRDEAEAPPPSRIDVAVARVKKAFRAGLMVGARPWPARPAPRHAFTSGAMATK